MKHQYVQYFSRYNIPKYDMGWNYHLKNTELKWQHKRGLKGEPFKSQKIEIDPIFGEKYSFDSFCAWIQQYDLKVTHFSSGSLNLILDFFNVLFIFGLQNYPVVKDILMYILAIFGRINEINTDSGERKIQLPAIPKGYVDIIKNYDEFELIKTYDRFELRCKRKS